MTHDSGLPHLGQQNNTNPNPTPTPNANHTNPTQPYLP